MANRYFRIELVVIGVGFMAIYPLAVLWPSRFVWHHGAPHESSYFMMIVGIYATLGVFLIAAARDPAANLSLIWFTVWSSLVHAAIMLVQSFSPGHSEHLSGDVPLLILVAVILGVRAKRIRRTNLIGQPPAVVGLGA